MPSLMLWLDFETSGLEPDGDLLLEIAALVSDLDGRALLSFSQLVFHPELTLGAIACWPEAVQEMHSGSGLLGELLAVAAGALGAAMLEEDAWRDLWRSIGSLTEKHRAPAFILAGNGADHMERLWLRYHQPRLLDHLTYWSIDPSVIRRSLALWGHDGPPREEPAHRALADCRQALREWREQRALLSASLPGA